MKLRYLTQWILGTYLQPVFTCSKFINRNTKIRCEICSKLTINTPKRSDCCRFGVVIVKTLLRIYFTSCSSVSIVKFEHVIAGWAEIVI